MRRNYYPKLKEEKDSTKEAEVPGCTPFYERQEKPDSNGTRKKKSC